MNKTLFFVTILFIGIAFGCGNQGNNNSQQFGPGGFGDRGNFDPEEIAERQVERLTEQLDLSKDQQKQVYDLTIENFENMSKMRGQGGGDFEAMREQMQKAREEQNKKMKTILTDDQWGKYEIFQEEMRARRGQGRPGGFGGQQ
ncbi:DUF4890 domain-containing protein [Maribellus maritimus]|uniref:DUF4890 domain-containing protein n=1 Tax=Maribellus maritimus TaxID=2870838 RepID=UPI001EEB4837|nr:DUF4890 domain-containing protein [Maribellus maritimus]MCG6187766.1 DUF4890 domain-containing protein [Maribellus maritimus]